MDNRILVVDLETTGFDAAEGGAVEAAVVEADLEEGEHRVLLSTLCDPEAEITQQASAVHGITQEMLRDAPLWTEVRDEVRTLLQQGTPCAHAAYFEKRFIGDVGKEWLDTVQVARRAWPGLGSHRLAPLVQYLKIKLPAGTEAHRALGDAWASAEVLRRSGWRRPTKGEEEAEQAEKCMELLPWGRYKGWPLEDIPSQYLEWVVDRRGLGEATRRAVRKQLDRRRTS